MSSANFNPNTFKDYVLQAKLFSVPTKEEKRVSDVQNAVNSDVAPTEKPQRSFLGRSWTKGAAISKNIYDATVSKFQRFKANANERQVLTGNAKGKISNKAILSHLDNNVNKSTSLEDCKNLKMALTALRSFGADAKKCDEIESKISEKNIAIIKESLESLTTTIGDAMTNWQCQKLKLEITSLKTLSADPSLLKGVEAQLEQRTNLVAQGYRCSRDKMRSMYDLPVGKVATEEAAAAKGKKRKDKTDEDVATSGRAKNLGKALEEHLVDARDKDKNAFITTQQLTEIQATKKEGGPPPVTLSHYMTTDIGFGRKTNEDAEFVNTIEIGGKDVGTLAGILDGHSANGQDGKKVADLIGSKFPGVFAEELEAADGNITVAFEWTFARMQEIILAAGLGTGGSTAVISFVEKGTNRVYTATLGDSEAMISREGKLIPLSPVRDWGSKEDRKRAEGNLYIEKYSIDSFGNEYGGHFAHISTDEIAKGIAERQLDPKHIRIGGTFTNVSRSFGDSEASGISQKPKITEFQLEPGDKLILVCDGVPDYLTPNEIAEGISAAADTIKERGQSPSNQTIAERLIEKAKTNMRKEGGGDNVSVVAISVEAA